MKIEIEIKSINDNQVTINRKKQSKKLWDNSTDQEKIVNSYFINIFDDLIKTLDLEKILEKLSKKKED